MTAFGITVEQALRLRPGDRVWNASYPNSEFVVRRRARALNGSNINDVWVPTTIMTNGDRNAPDRLNMINHLIRIVSTLPECLLLPQGV